MAVKRMPECRCLLMRGAVKGRNDVVAVEGGGGDGGSRRDATDGFRYDSKSEDLYRKSEIAQPRLG